MGSKITKTELETKLKAYETSLETEVQEAELEVKETAQAYNRAQDRLVLAMANRTNFANAMSAETETPAPAKPAEPKSEDPAGPRDDENDPEHELDDGDEEYSGDDKPPF